MAAPSGYGYYKEILIQDANVDGNLTDFPTYVFIDADGDIGGNIVDDTTGHDIRFYDVDTDAEIPYEREFFEVATGDCNAHFWVKVPFVYASPTGNENKIRIYYGKVADSDGEDAVNTWNSNYKAVLHLNESGNGSDDEFLDSTGNANHGTGGGVEGSGDSGKTPNQGTGPYYKCQDYTNANDDNIQVSDANSLDITDEITISCWTKSSGWVGDDAGLICKSNTAGGKWYSSNATMGYEMGVLNDGLYWQASDGTNKNSNSGVSVSGEDDGTWRHYVCTWDGTDSESDNFNTYHNTVVDNQSLSAITAIQATTETLALGGEIGGQYSIEGSLCEVRIMAFFMTDAWNKFEYHNIIEGDNELSWGEETAVGTHYTIECTTGTYAVTGATLNALRGSKAICTTGTYAVTGATLNALKGSKIACATGSYAITGSTLDPVYQPNVIVVATVFGLVATFNAAGVSLGAAGYGDQVHMFMSLSMN